MAQSASLEALQLKVLLDEVRPPVWRRVLVPTHYNLTQLHRVIQVAFGWEDSHLHLFKIHGKIFGSPESDTGRGLHGEGITLAKLGLPPKSKFEYEYDFGDSWVHVVTVEKVVALSEPVTVPVCLEGMRACPPEDCGGAWGYQEMLEALGDPEHPSHEDFKEWLEGGWNPESFDLEKVNASLAKAFKPKTTPRNKKATNN